MATPFKGGPELMNELRKEYGKFVENAQKKIGETKKTIDDAMKGHAEEFNKFLQQAKTDKDLFVETKLKPTSSFWKKPEPFKRPEGLKVGLLGVTLFAGNEIFSKAIRKLTKSKFSHVALLLYDVSKPKDDQEGWYIYSANGSAEQLLQDHRLPQVQGEKWLDSIKGYDGAVGTRMILFQDKAPDSDHVTKLVDQYLGLPYETQLLVMFKAINRENVESAEQVESAFCSDICYRFLSALGVLNEDYVPENVLPKDFSDENQTITIRNGKWDKMEIRKGVFSYVD